MFSGAVKNKKKTPFVAASGSGMLTTVIRMQRINSLKSPDTIWKQFDTPHFCEVLLHAYTCPTCPVINAAGMLYVNTFIEGVVSPT